MVRYEGAILNYSCIVEGSRTIQGGVLIEESALNEVVRYSFIFKLLLNVMKIISDDEKYFLIVTRLSMALFVDNAPIHDM